MDNENTPETEAKTETKPPSKIIIENRMKKDESKDEPKDNGKKETKSDKGLKLVKKETKAPAKPTFEYIPVTKITIEPNSNPRKIFEREALKELADSIRTKGIINPLTVTLRNGQYVLVAGERRLRAAKIVGLTEVPTIIKAADEADLVDEDLIRLMENVQRADLSPMEEALNFKKLLGKVELQPDPADPKKRIPVTLTAKNLAHRVGKSAGYISQRLSLLELHKDIQQALVKQEITSSQARELHAAGDEKLQLKLLAKIRGSGETVQVKDLKKDIDRSKAQRNLADDGKRRGRPPKEDGVAPNVARQGLEAALEHLREVKLSLKGVKEVREGMAMVYERFDKAKSDEKKMFYKGAIAALEWATGIKEDV